MHINFQKFTRAAKKIRDGRIKYNGKLGRRPYLPESFEAEILKTISALRALKYVVRKQDVLQWANQLVKGTHYADRILNGVVTSSWYEGFKSRNFIKYMIPAPLEQDRAEWLTSANIKILSYPKPPISLFLIHIRFFSLINHFFNIKVKTLTFLNLKVHDCIKVIK